MKLQYKGMGDIEMEVWDLYDGERNPLGKKHVRGNKLQPGEFHIVVEVITLNADGRIS